jgi:hypothetical protein
MNMFETIEQCVRAAADSLSLPVGWEGEPFIVPDGAHVRAKIALAETRAATIGKNGRTRVSGYAELRVVAPAEDAEAATPSPAELAKTLAASFPRGMALYLEDAVVTFTFPAFQAPGTDGKHKFAAVNLNFYAHYGALPSTL